MPNIEAGNVMYKTLTYAADCKNGGLLVGTSAPVVLTSRSDSHESKLNAIALAALVASQLKNKYLKFREELKMGYKLLIINPGSTSTKIGVYEDENQILEETLRHSSQEIESYKTIFDQFEFRKEVILNVLKEKSFDVNELDAIVGRGGLLKPIEGGTYRVNDVMIEDLKIGVQGQHASNLGGIIANEIGKILTYLHL